MNRKWKLFYCLSITLLFACGTESPQEKIPPVESKPIIAEDDLLTRLSMQLISNPKIQAHQDQNTIVDYAIGALLDVQRKESGLYYQIVEEGDLGEPHARWGDLVSIKYRGSFLDGKVFDQSKEGKPLKVKLHQVILGWQEAIPMLRKGGKGIFLIPSHLAYGEEGFGDKIPPHSVLKFEIELVDIDR